MRSRSLCLNWGTHHRSLEDLSNCRIFVFSRPTWQNLHPKKKLKGNLKNCSKLEFALFLGAAESTFNGNVPTNIQGFQLLRRHFHQTGTGNEVHFIFCCWFLQSTVEKLPCSLSASHFPNMQPWPVLMRCVTPAWLLQLNIQILTKLSVQGICAHKKKRLSHFKMTFFSFRNIVYKWIEQVLFLSGSMPHGYPQAKNGNPSWNSLSSFPSTSHTAVWVNWWCYHQDKKREGTDEAGSGQTSQPIRLNAKEFMTLLTSIYSRFRKMESVLFLTI